MRILASFGKDSYGRQSCPKVAFLHSMGFAGIVLILHAMNARLLFLRLLLWSSVAYVGAAICEVKISLTPYLARTFPLLTLLADGPGLPRTVAYIVVIAQTPCIRPTLRRNLLQVSSAAIAPALTLRVTVQKQHSIIITGFVPHALVTLLHFCA